MCLPMIQIQLSIMQFLQEAWNIQFKKRPTYIILYCITLHYIILLIQLLYRIYAVQQVCFINS